MPDAPLPTDPTSRRRRQTVLAGLVLALALATVPFSLLFSAHDAAGKIDAQIVAIEPGGAVKIQYTTTPGHYDILLHSADLVTWTTSQAKLSTSPTAGEFTDAGPMDTRTFFQIVQVPNDAPRDSDADQIDDYYELTNPDILDPFDPSDAAPHLDAYLTLKNQPTTLSISPADNETGVAITRETVVRFSNPLAPDTVIDASTLFATFAGEKLPAHIHLSDDRDTATLFYDDYLPASALIQVVVAGDALRDPLYRPVDADRDGTPGGTGRFTFQTLSVTTLPGTVVCGRVFASELADAASGDDAVNCPLQGVKITVDGREDDLFAITDQFGNFRLDPAPVGRFFVHIDGRTATNPTIPDGAYYPFVGKAWESTAEIEINVGEIYLPLVASGTLTETSATEPTEVTFPAAVLAQEPTLAGTRLDIPADNVLSPDGSRGGSVGIAPVDPNRLPGTLPPGLNFPVVVTVQTDGPGNFDQPVPVRFPNLPDPDTGQPLPPGAKSALWSFDHDIGRFLVSGPMTVSADGLWVTTDPGVGILAPGWHGFSPGTSGSGGPAGNNGNGNGEGCDPDQPKQCPPPCDPGSTGTPDTDPVRPFSGEMILTETDLTIKGRGMDFKWVRTYASKNGRKTAQGNNWEFNYNFKLERSGRILKVHNGYVEVKEFQQDPDGNYERREHFVKIIEKPDGSCEKHLGDQTVIGYNPLASGQPDAGKMHTVTDRNGNAMAFAYDAQGRLTTITDTLGRDIAVAYNPDGFIATVTDFTGRQLTYDYYQDGDPGGSFGDLKSVTSPAVTGTPHGNDFPAGKTRTYTYTTGFADDRLNHNLLTVTDGRRNDPSDPTFNTGPYVVNDYSNTTDPDDPRFDRVVHQVWGGGHIHLDYQVFKPADPVAATATLTTINDRNGNVAEWHYNAHNQLVSLRELTGRATPDQPTTPTANRPKNKLRPSDPAFFETRWTYNDDGQVHSTIYPNGNRHENVYQSDLDPLADVRVRGNLREKIFSPGAHLPAGDQPQIVEQFEYANDFACASCGFNFVTRHVDARGNETLSTFDANGNLTQRTHRIAAVVENFEYNQFGQLTAHVHPDNGAAHHRRDEFTYHATGPQTGYRATMTSDATGFAYTTSYHYDALGRKTRTVDPRNFDRLYTYNALDQVVQEFSRETAPGSGIRYEKRTWFDANNNITRIDTENRDATGTVVAANPWFTTTFDYEILNLLVRSTQEATPTKNITTEYAYDPNRNQTLVRYGEATNGNQPANTVTQHYDERDLLFLTTRADGHPDQSTRQLDYDANGNLVADTHGLEAGGHTTTFTVDGYNRRITKTDPMGNVCTYNYDPNANLTREVCLGELQDLPGSTNNIRLREMAYTYDALDRRTVENRAHFKHDPDGTEITIGDGSGTTTTLWSDFSQPLSTTNDNNHTTTYTYDTANRLLTTTDAKDNTVTVTYDANNNRVSMLETDKSDLGNPDQQFTTTFAYDGLDRLAATIDNIGNTNQIEYDSRSNRAATVDAKRNRIEYTYDGLNRLLATDRFMTDTGDGTGTVVDHIVTKQYWDDSSRLVGQEDDNGNRTTYVLDGLNRKVADVYADNTRWNYTYDPYDTQIRRVDANGSIVVSTFDLNDRVTGIDVTTGQGVSDATTFEIYKYDGLDRLVHGEDDDSVVKLAFDSLSQRLEDSQEGGTVKASVDAVGNITGITYPSGGAIHQSFDENELLSTITLNATELANFSYVGTGRIEEIARSNGTVTTTQYNGVTGTPNEQGDYGVKRTATLKHMIPSNPIESIDEHNYSWDQAGNKTKTINPTGSSSFSYDSANRMIASTKPSSTTDYTLDGAGNRSLVTSGASTTAYAADPNDGKMNRYSTTGLIDYLFDKNGNRTRDGELQLNYDYANRLVSATSETIEHVYGYDIFGRRISLAHNGETQTFQYLDWSCIAEQNLSTSDATRHYYGPGIDAVIASAPPSGNLRFYHQTDTLSVVAITDESGNVAQRYDYGDFGEPTAAPPFASPFLFQARRRDPETGYYYYRSRYYDVLPGEFLTRDTIGIWADRINVGRGRTFVGNNPQSKIDPFGYFTLPDFNIGANVSITGCYPFGISGVHVCVSGSHTLRIGSCKDCSKCPQERRAYTQGDLGFSFTLKWSPVVSLPSISASVSKPIVRDLACCPNPNERHSGGGTISVEIGYFYVNCTYTDSWSCESGVTFSGSPSVSVSGGGFYSYRYLHLN